jgi:hypothetical protein
LLGGIAFLLMSSLANAVLQRRCSVVTITLALVVVELDALGVAILNDLLKGLPLLDIVVADVELGQRPHIGDGVGKGDNTYTWTIMCELGYV